MIKELIAPDGSQRSEHPITITFAMKNGEVVLTNFDDGKVPQNWMKKAISYGMNRMLS